jgi:dTDP-4-amino-4,6-dideoxygalactose transaminase
MKTLTETRIFLSPPHLGEDEARLVSGAIASNWVAPAGPNLRTFEAEFCAMSGNPHAVALSSGTAALHLAARLLGFAPGDEFFCSDLTFVASANPAVQEGARPVFIDAEETSWNMDPDLLEAALADRARRGRLPKAVVVVDIYGQCANWPRISEICRRYEVPVIEDAAEAVGATCGGAWAGTFGELAAYSFNGNKILTTGGGGMLVGRSAELVEHAHQLATQARETSPHYEHRELGYNYRMSNVLAAIGLGQLRVLPERIAARRRIFATYREALGGLPGLDFMPEAPWGESTRWLTCLTVDPQLSGVTREDLRLALEAANIEARPVWKPMHLQPLYAEAPCVGGRVAERLFERGLCLPSGSSLSPSEQLRVIDTIRGVFGSA